MNYVGEISRINRYPVKSFNGEELDTCKVDTYGLYGDRFCAFYDEKKDGWKSFITARDLPQMLKYTAKVIDDKVCISSSDGQFFGWDSELLSEIQKYTGKFINMKNYKSPHPEDPELMSVDVASILIITERSLRLLETKWGKRLDHRRFRANLIISFSDDILSDENEWIGRRLSVGDIELQVDKFCDRCSMITLDPDTLERESTLLKKVHEEMSLNFGVYASVKKTGQIYVGDKVYLID